MRLSIALVARLYVKVATACAVGVHRPAHEHGQGEVQ